MTGQLSTHKGSGSGSVNVSLRRITSPDGWAELEMGFGSGLSLSAKGFRNLTKRIFTNISGIVTSTDRGFTLGFVSSKLILTFCIYFSHFHNTIFFLALAHQLDKNTVGYLTYKASGPSSMSTMVVKDTSRYRAQVNFVLGIPHSYFAITYCHKLEKHDGRLRGAIKSVNFLL